LFGSGAGEVIFFADEAVPLDVGISFDSEAIAAVRKFIVAEYEEEF
jgi:hypothetical protein